MEVTFEILYQKEVVSQEIPKLSRRIGMRVRRAIEEKLMVHPELYGKPLRRSLKGYRKLRVGDYRVVYRIEKKCVKILVIQHRSIVYKTAQTK